MAMGTADTSVSSQPVIPPFLLDNHSCMHIHQNALACLLGCMHLSTAGTTTGAHDSRVLLQAAADHLEQRIGQYNPQNVCNILWTYATLGYYPGGSPLDVAADYALHALEVSCFHSTLPHG